jgi:DNA invertase Pin-like site-specific DNA recombinase
LKHQKEFFTEYAQKNGHKLMRVYADEGISGTSLKNRLEFQRMMEDAPKGLFEAVVVKDISRLARNTVDLLQSIRTLKHLGINTIFLTSNMESMGESEFVLTMFAAMAQEESVNLSKRVKFGKLVTAQMGRVPQRVFGYDHVDNFTLAINPKEADIVRMIFHLYLEEGLGCRTISLELNRRGCKTKSDCDWNPRTIRRVLTNSIYCGDYVNHKYEVRDCLEGKLISVPAQKQIHHERPEWAIVTPEVFAKTQRLLSERRVQYETNGEFHEGRHSTRHIFSTLIRCAHCGRAFCRKTYTHVNTRIYWKCTTNDQYTAETCDNRVTVDESSLLENIRQYFASLIEDRQVFIQNVLTEVEKRLPTEKDDAQELEKRKKSLQKKKEKYQEMYTADIITIDELDEKTQGIRQELANVEARLEKSKHQNNDDAPKGPMAKRYADEIERFLMLENVTNADMRKIIKNITVDRNGKVEISLRDIRDFS